MKISDKTNLTGTQRRKLSLGLLLLLFFGGVIAGTIAICAADDVKTVSSRFLTQNLFKTAEIKTVGEILFCGLIPLIIMLIVQFLSGFFAFGQVITILGIVYRGASAGVAASLFYLTLGMKGFFAILIMLLPFVMASTVILILGARESIRSSNVFFNFAFKKRVEDDSYSGIKLYAIKFIVLMAFCLVISAADCVITYFFTGILLKP